MSINFLALRELYVDDESQTTLGEMDVVDNYNEIAKSLGAHSRI